MLLCRGVKAKKILCMRVAGEQLENPEVDLEDLRVDLWRSRTRGFNQEEAPTQI